MDALPIEESGDLPFKSVQRGKFNGKDVPVMHACGHDTHMAMLMGAAKILTDMQDDLVGQVKFIFQPAEEGSPEGEVGGAEIMVEEGVLKNPDVDAIFGLHISAATKQRVNFGHKRLTIPADFHGDIDNADDRIHTDMLKQEFNVFRKHPNTAV